MKSWFQKRNGCLTRIAFDDLLFGFKSKIIRCKVDTSEEIDLCPGLPSAILDVLRSQNLRQIHFVNFLIFFTLIHLNSLAFGCRRVKKKHNPCGLCRGFISDPDRIRTCDLLLRRQLLYPAELRDRYFSSMHKILNII